MSVDTPWPYPARRQLGVSMTEYPLTDFRMQDGSRNFLTLPIHVGPHVLWRSLRPLALVKRGRILLTVTDSWIIYHWEEWPMSIHDPYGEYWFYAEDALTPEPILHAIRDHFLAVAL
ncbi:hypothetical protein KUV73_14835 [Mameliella alba]|nr:hypothetical protein [Mameliella alba]MBY6170631.1 hypothetical protein [Mameliella alba]MBY6175649.1 hypothetical protein [Mameliella alba]